MKEELSKEEARMMLSHLHDEIKNNSYWNTFNTDEFRDVYHLFMKMESVFYRSPFSNRTGSIYYENPIAALIDGAAHEVNRMMGRVLDGEAPSDNIITIQGFLSLFHCLIDNCEHASLCIVSKNRKNGQTNFWTMIPSQSEEGWSYAFVEQNS